MKYLVIGFLGVFLTGCHTPQDTKPSTPPPPVVAEVEPPCDEKCVSKPMQVPVEQKKVETYKGCAEGLETAYVANYQGYFQGYGGLMVCVDPAFMTKLRKANGVPEPKHMK